MRRISEAEAYRAWHAEDRRQQRRRRTKALVESIKCELQDALDRQRLAEQELKTMELTASMLNDRAFNKVLKRYWGHTPKGWVAACGCDGRMKALAKDWPVLEETIRRVRIAKGMARMPCRCEARVMPDATLQLKIKLGYGR
jgi:hypothetical protein